MSVNGSPFEFYQFREGSHDFWRCFSCGLIFTYEQERARVAMMEHDMQAAMCPCGSLRYKPTKPRSRPRWGFSPLRLFSRYCWISKSEWLEPNVLTYTLKLVLARGLAPWLEAHYPKALPRIERLVQPSLEG